MPRFLPEYKTIDTRSTGEKVVLGVSLAILLLFMPATVLGYYAEKSIPGQPLYPIKRGLETAVLTIESFSPYSKSLYYQRLAQTRVDETSTLIADAAATGDTAQLTTQTTTTLNDAYSSIQQAAVSIQTISDPVQKQKAQQQLAVSIQNYQTQLSQMTYTIQKNIVGESNPTPPPANANNTAQATPTPTPDPAAALQNQINQTQNNLQNILQQTQITPTPTPTLAPAAVTQPVTTPTPTPTSAPTTVTQPVTTPTPTPTSAPWWWQQWQHGNRQGGPGGQQSGD